MSSRGQQRDKDVGVGMVMAFAVPSASQFEAGDHIVLTKVQTPSGRVTRIDAIWPTLEGQGIVEVTPTPTGSIVSANLVEGNHIDITNGNEISAIWPTLEGQGIVEVTPTPTGSIVSANLVEGNHIDITNGNEISAIWPTLTADGLSSVSPTGTGFVVHTPAPTSLSNITLTNPTINGGTVNSTTLNTPTIPQLTAPANVYSFNVDVTQLLDLQDGVTVRMTPKVGQSPFKLNFWFYQVTTDDIRVKCSFSAPSQVDVLNHEPAYTLAELDAFRTTAMTTGFLTHSLSGAPTWMRQMANGSAYTSLSVAHGTNHLMVRNDSLTYPWATAYIDIHRGAPGGNNGLVFSLCTRPFTPNVNQGSVFSNSIELGIGFATTSAQGYTFGNAVFTNINAIVRGKFDDQFLVGQDSGQDVYAAYAPPFLTNIGCTIL
ncbi:MAG: hypothetical protein WC763_06955 [Candidatus Paceibacterota bacterium]|jgi:hypothetical protein